MGQKKDTNAAYNTLVGQLDRNFRTIADVVSELELPQKMGKATLVAGQVEVNDSTVKKTSIIILTSQVDGGTPGFLRVQSVIDDTSFKIVSSNAADTSTVAWIIIKQ